MAAKQHGVLTFTQLKNAGLTPTQIRSRARKGHLHRIHRGVYALGHAALSARGRWIAAVLAYGDTAVLSHRSAAELWQLLPPRGGFVDVTVRSARDKRPGLRLHRSTSLPGTAITARHGIRVTTPARTLTDLKRVVPPHVHRKAIRQAEYLGLPLEELTTDHTRSDLERDFLRLCRRHHLPEPEVNVPIGPFTVDFLWRDQRLVIETDGWAAHRGSQAFEDDHQRELELHARGFRVRRFTKLQIREQGAAVARSVRRELALPSA